MSTTNDSQFSKWLRNGRLSTIVWGVVFVVWITFKILKIDAGTLDTVFVTMTGSWVANLTLMTTKKETETQHRVEKLERTVGEEGE